MHHFFKANKNTDNNLDPERIWQLLEQYGTEHTGEAKAPLFIVGTGRCGTHLYYELFNRDQKIKAMHESMLLQNVDSFRRYCLWNKLPVDHSFFFTYRNALLNQCAAQNQVYVESNTYASMSVSELHQRYQANTILALRNPVDVVKSICHKGWYRDEPMHDPHQGALGFQLYGLTKMNHFFGRIVPTDPAEYRRWQSLTQVGKVAWFVNALNLEVLKQLATIPQQRKRIIFVEQFDYPAYLDLHHFTGSTGQPLPENLFQRLTDARPGKMKGEKPPWNEEEKEQFLNETKELRQVVDYGTHCDFQVGHFC